MRKALTIGILTLAALALVASAAFACGHEECKALKTCAAMASSVNVSGSCDGTGGLIKAEAAAGDHCVIKTISVKGMTCAGCEESIRTELAKLPGVVEVIKVSYESSEAIVRVDPEKAQDDQLTRAITDKGYQAEVIPAVARTVEADSKGPVCPFSGAPGCDAMKAAGGDCQKVHSASATKPSSEEKSKKK